MQLGTLDDDVGEIEQVDLERIQHTLSGDDDLFGLFFDGERSDQSGDFFGSLPLGELTETFLTRPDRSVNDLEEELTGSRVEDEDSSVDRLGGQVSLERLVDGDSIDIGVVDEPDDLIREEFRIVARVEVWLCRLGRVELETLSDTLSQDVQGRVGLHDLGHTLLHQGLHSREPNTVTCVQVVGKIDSD